MQMPKGSAITKTEAADAIYVISRISGEGADRKAEPGDYYLSEQEEEELKAITECYDNTIVILNVGGVMDVSFLEKYNIAALVMLSQAGMEGGNALADVLSGAVTPSGKLTDTWGCRYEDIRPARRSAIITETSSKKNITRAFTSAIVISTALRWNRVIRSDMECPIRPLT